MVLLSGRVQLLSPEMGIGPVWRSHFQLPVPRLTSGFTAELLFSGRDEFNRSHGFRAQIDLSSSPRATFVEPDPVLSPGLAGAFDEDGVMPSSVLSVGNELWMYYVGWKRTEDKPFRTEIGLAISDDGGKSYHRARESAVLGLQADEPFAVSQPCVWQTPDGYQMIYSSVRDWRAHDGRLEPRYLLRRARSSDGLHWRTEKTSALGFASDEEGGLSRPTILHRNRLAFLLYSYRSWRGFRTDKESAYRLGFAYSADGETWTRRDGALGFSEQAEPGTWDFLMQAYPALLEWGNTLFCFYSGNGFGRSGLGYATLDVNSLGDELEAINPTM